MTKRKRPLSARITDAANTIFHMVIVWCLFWVLTPYAMMHYHMQRGFDNVSFNGQRWDGDRVLSVNGDNGGLVIPRMAHTQWLIDRDARVEVSGVCASACTSYLAVPDLCTTPRALWMFHRSYGLPRAGGSDPIYDDGWGARYIDHIRRRGIAPELRKWIAETEGSMAPSEALWVSGQDFIDAGWVAQCPGSGNVGDMRFQAERLSDGFAAPHPMPNNRDATP